MTPGNHLNSSLYFWWAAPLIFVFKYFWWIPATLIVFAFPILRVWWWLFFPIFLWFPLKEIYLHWIRWDVWYSARKWTMVELFFPPEVLKPFKAIEDFFTRLWGVVFDSPNWREQWCEGGNPIGFGGWISLEIVSLGGQIHFYVYLPQGSLSAFSAALYAHFPEIEIASVKDYTYEVPQDIPNNDYEVLGECISFVKPHVYPIKTYSEFFEEKIITSLTAAEVIRIDPLNSLIEQLAKLAKNEQFWFQIIITPVIDKMVGWITEGKEIAAKIARRGTSKKQSVFLRETKKIIFSETGPVTTREIRKLAGTSGPSSALPPSKTETGELEMVITPRERELLANIEKKMSKSAYLTTIRCLYLAKKDKPYDVGNSRIGKGYLGHFSSADSNSFLHWGPTRVRIHYFLRQRRLYLRARKLFRNYVRRFPPLWPEMPAGLGTPILNTEELATIFHPPFKPTISSVPTIKAKPAGPPAGLPVEE